MGRSIRLAHNIRLFCRGKTSGEIMGRISLCLAHFYKYIAGVVTKLIAKEGKSATTKLPFEKVRLLFENCSIERNEIIGDITH